MGYTQYGSTSNYSGRTPGGAAVLYEYGVIDKPFSAGGFLSKLQMGLPLSLLKNGLH
jgi:hypothetical protein